MKIKFEKKKESILDTVFLQITYMSGDADAWEYEEVPFGKHIKYSNYTEHLDEIEKVIKQYQLISKFTNDSRSSIPGKEDIFDYIYKNHSKELAYLYDEVPGDSTTDGEFKAFLSNITLCAYNDKGEYFESYIKIYE